MDPSFLSEIFEDTEILGLYFTFIHRYCLPLSWIFLILQEIDTRMSDMRKSIMEESDRAESFSWSRVGETDDEIDIDIRMSCLME